MSYYKQQIALDLTHFNKDLIERNWYWLRIVGNLWLALINNSTCGCFRWLLGVRVFWHLSEDEWSETNHLFKMVLDTMDDPYLHEQVRSSMKPFFIHYAKALPVTNSMTMAMSAFIICHEIAHYTLGYIGQPLDKQHELDADKQGYLYLQRVCQAFDDTASLKVSENMMAVPSILMDLFDLNHNRFGYSHRCQNLSENLSCTWTQEAESLYEGFQSTVQEVLKHLGLDELQLHPEGINENQVKC